VASTYAERPVPSQPVTPPSPPQPRAESIPSPEAKTPPNLTDKLRDDWHTIKHGFASAGDDFKSTMRDFARKLTGQ
jgi:hypothetical protein